MLESGIFFSHAFLVYGFNFGCTNVSGILIMLIFQFLQVCLLLEYIKLTYFNIIFLNYYTTLSFVWQKADLRTSMVFIDHFCLGGLLLSLCDDVALYLLQRQWIILLPNSHSLTFPTLLLLYIPWLLFFSALTFYTHLMFFLRVSKYSQNCLMWLHWSYRKI